MVETNDEIAIKLEEALKAAKANIHPHCLGKGMALEKEDYKTLGTTVFIERQRLIRDEKRQEEREAKKQEPCTEKQQNYIGSLMARNKESAEIRRQFLENVDKKAMTDLTVEEASSLIDILKEKEG